MGPTLAIAAACALHAFAPSALAADGWPAKAVRIVVPYATGGGSDILARQIGAGLQPLWKQGIVVDNKAGASGNIGTQEVVRAAADGYTLLLQNSTMVVNQAVMGKLGYDPAKDLTPIMLLGLTPMALAAHPAANIGDLKALVAAAGATPAGLSYGSCGIGTPQHFVMELLKQKAGIYVTHIPYRGGPLGMQDVIAGQVDVMFIAVGPALPHIRSGRLVALGASGEKRHALLPEVPTVAETYAGYRSGTRFGLFAPAHTPQPVLDAIATEAGRIVQAPTARADLAVQGIEATGFPQRQFQRQVSAEYERYAQIVKAVGIKAE